MAAALRDQIRWCSFGVEINSLQYFNFVRPFTCWYNTCRMNRYINRQLDQRYSKFQRKPKGKSVIDLALKSYLASKAADEVAGIDATFKEFAISQIKLFIFAGHDTTSATVCFIFHLLSKNLKALSHLQDEHSAVFGTNLVSTPGLIAKDPKLLSNLPYTLAVIKEALRLFPPVSATRAGQPKFFLSGSDGRLFPTGGCLVWGNHHGLHHNPQYWPHAEEFLPDRWLASEGEALYPAKDAWRPFERDSRQCIGQELALVEIKIILVIMLREFSFKDAYEDWDALRGNSPGQNVVGQRAYQIVSGGAHPS